MNEIVKKQPRTTKSNRLLRCFLLLFSILLLTVALGSSASAADLRSKNLSLCETRSAELEGQLEAFKKIDTSEGGSYAQSVVSAVNRYRKQLLDLQSHPEIATRSLEAEIELAFLRGTAAGRLTWIYVTNAAVAINEAESRSFLASYEGLMRTLDTTEELTDASPTSFSGDLNVAIYSERIRSLAESGDSLRVGAILAGAIEEVRALHSGELSGDTYRAILEEKRAEATLQRHRDALYSDFCAFYGKLAPASDAESDEITSLLLYRLSNNSTLSDMNTSLRLAANTLLERFETEAHKKAYVSTVKEQLSREITSAQSTGRRACISALVSDFSLRYLIADAKDRVDSMITASSFAPADGLTRLGAEYTAENGILDRCANETELALELWRAALRVDWWEELAAAKESISTMLTPHDLAAMQKKAETEWAAIDARICAVLRSDPNAKASCTEAVNRGKAALASLLLDTEAEKFRLDHIAIIEQAQSTLKAEDREALIFAIEKWNALSLGAKERLSSESGKLRESYRAVITLVLKESIKNDKAYEFRKSNVDQLCTELSKLSATDPAEFREVADSFAVRVESLMLLLDQYHEIQRSSDYEKYVEKYKEEIRTVIESGCLAIRSLSFVGNKPTEELSALLQRSLLNLTKVDAMARITLAAEQSTRTEITSAIRIAEAQIGAATDQARVIALADACILSIRTVILSENAEELSSTVKQKLEALSFLSAEKRQELYAALEVKRGEVLTALPLAANLTELNLSYTTYTIACDGILAQGKEISLHACKEDARAQLLSLITRAKEELTALPEPEEEIKAEFYTNLEALQTDYVAKIHLATEESTVASLLSAAKANADKQITDARLYKIRLYRAELLNALETEFGISSHYSAEHYEEIRQIITDFRSELEKRETSEEYESLLKITKERLANIPTLLAEAKANASLALKEEYDRLSQQAAAYSQANRDLLQRTLAQYLTSAEEISNIQDYQKVYQLLEEGLTALAAIPRDRLYNGPASLTDTSYPTGFDPQKSGLWGVITQEGGIPSDRKLNISILPLNSDDFSNLIQQAIQNKALLSHSGEKLSFSLRKNLKQAELLLALNIQTVLPTADGFYRVEILLPNGYDPSDLLGAVWFGADGSAEYYNAEISGSVVSFETSHFSSFYLVTKSKINLVPAIFFVCFLILAELVILALLLYRRSRRNQEAKDTLSDSTPPSLPFSAFLATAPAFRKTVPQNGPLLLTLLIGTSVLLGVAVSFLVKEEWAYLRAKDQAKETEGKQTVPRLSAARRMALPSAKAALSISRARGALNEAADPKKEQQGGVALANCEPEALSEESPLSEASCSEIKWAELNLDTLSRHFSAGDCVTPELLKQMGLVPENTTHLKILARGRLVIPLFISAQEFSNAALRSIKKAGGKAYRIQ